ncbi:putative spherulin [Podospora fimiseda]|uniref:Spherulin n=1 Tax=Podospora fimiseda TaxID=252190 RepID=A0AAN7BKD3_9PEZI|nr:putative spherulin [Podospora fimiseda]
MFSQLIHLLALASLATAAPQHLTSRDTPSPNLGLTAQLTLADTTIDRYALLKDQDFIFDFSAPNAPPIADRKSFPALVGTNVAVAVAEVPPCSMAPIHLHPRATEILTVTSGRLMTEMVTEAIDANGNPRLVRTELKKGQVTVFPMGSFHTQLNLDCTNASAVAAFNSEDPGVEVVVNGLEGLGGADDREIRGAVSKIFKGEFEECKKRCGL